MPFPNLAGKHAHDALFTAGDFLAYLREAGQLPDVAAPRGAVLFYQRPPAVHVIGNPRPPDLHLFAPVHVVERDGRRAAVASGFGVGAPVAALVLEHLVAWGVRRVLSIGIAGGLQPGALIGDVVVCTAAVRDEGVSHHYVASGRAAGASAALSSELTAELDARHIAHQRGESWTIDAPYRETLQEARHYQGEGVLSVEMEAAALFTVGRARGVDVAAAFVLSDSLAEDHWTPRFFDPDVDAALEALADAALACALH